MALCAVGSHLLGQSPVLTFVIAAVALALLAWLIGVATENLGAVVGPRAGGVLNATLGNTAELVITIFALRAGLSTVVKASITGSILGNILLVLGLSFLVAGLRHGELRFSRVIAGMHGSLLSIAVVALVVPAVFAQTIGPGHDVAIEHLSIGVAVVLIVTYVLSLIFFFRTPEAAGSELTRAGSPWSAKRAAAVLALATVGTVAASDVLVDAVRPTMAVLHLSEVFVGIIIVPLIGNISENIVSLRVALHNDLDFSMVVSLGASLQVALFVAPLLVFLSLPLGVPLTLIFTPAELVSIGLGTLIVTLIAIDGESNWFEGVELIAVYLIVAMTFFFYPT